MQHLWLSLDRYIKTHRGYSLHTYAVISRFTSLILEKGMCKNFLEYFWNLNFIVIVTFTISISEIVFANENSSYELKKERSRNFKDTKRNFLSHMLPIRRLFL